MIKRKSRVLVAIIATACSLGLSSASVAEAPSVGATIHQIVAQVYDGDGLWFEDGDGNPKTYLQVRLFGINAPEYNAPGGSDAKQFLRGKVVGQAVRCNIVELDRRYNRPVGVCFDTAGKDIACALVWYNHAEATHPKYFPCDRSRQPPQGLPPF
jgi:endonuclease YncB( thermonuclease family)